MQTYVVRRPGIASTGAELDAALTRLRSFEENPHALNALRDSLRDLRGVESG